MPGSLWTISVVDAEEPAPRGSTSCRRLDRNPAASPHEPVSNLCHHFGSCEPVVVSATTRSGTKVGAKEEAAGVSCRPWQRGNLSPAPRVPSAQVEEASTLCASAPAPRLGG